MDGALVKPRDSRLLLQKPRGKRAKEEVKKEGKEGEGPAKKNDETGQEWKEEEEGKEEQEDDKQRREGKREGKRAKEAGHCVVPYRILPYPTLSYPILSYPILSAYNLSVLFLIRRVRTVTKTDMDVEMEMYGDIRGCRYI